MVSGAEPATAQSRDLSIGNDYLRTVKEVTASSFTTEEDRREALQATYEVMAKLESPWESCVRFQMNMQPAVLAAIKVIKDLGLMVKWHERGDIPMTSAQLAELVQNCDPGLINRLLRLLAANGLVEQIPVDKFKPRNFFIELADPEFNMLTNFFYKIDGPAFTLIPEYLAHRNYKNPIDANDTVLKKSLGYEDMWTFMKENPEDLEMFNILQKVGTNLEPPWVDLYPHQRLISGFDPNRPLLVDVGGGIGQDILKFYNIYPETATRLYLQDLPEVIADANTKSSIPKAINKQEYNFFTPQTVKRITDADILVDARAYFMHHIIHDWPDDSAREILQMQKSAMKAGYSRLLIYDHVLEDEKSTVASSAFDIIMMMCFSAQERTEKQWSALLESVGLRITKIWRKPMDTYSVIEVEVPVV
ncbi:S-adenosyl-L-methionine-dependent methyltransferase [Colletotrichum cereale]|nr:S-adenosyl-L-methionine-dependent methyltransferase [Colletotrichum cereale]